MDSGYNEILSLGSSANGSYYWRLNVIHSRMWQYNIPHITLMYFIVLLLFIIIAQRITVILGGGGWVVAVVPVK